MAHASRSSARRYRRKLAAGWRLDDPIEPIDVLRKGELVSIERTRGNLRRDLFRYEGGRMVGLTTMAKYRGYRLP